MKRCIFFLLLVFVLPCAVQAQNDPVAGKTFTVVYHPPQGSPLAQASDLQLIYVFDFWNTRFGTRLALWQNVVSADTSRLHVADLRKGRDGWTADIPIPADAALLSYIVAGGGAVDGNYQKTFVHYVMNEKGEPVQNARVFNLPFLEMARAEIGVRIREAEAEIIAYPENFQAYNKYFTLLLEQAKGNPRIQQRIVSRLESLEKRFGQNDDFLNMAAETWFYVLQNPERALEYRKRISSTNMWPQVFRMFNQEEKQEQARQRASYNENRRKELHGEEFPDFNLMNVAGEKTAFPTGSGNPAAYVFWASVSEKSCDLLLALKAALSAFEKGELDVIAVNLDVDKEKGTAWFDQHQLPFSLMFNQGNVLMQLGVDSIPIMYFVDRENVIRHIQVGYAEEQSGALRSALDAIMK